MFKRVIASFAYANVSDFKHKGVEILALNISSGYQNPKLIWRYEKYVN